MDKAYNEILRILQNDSRTSNTAIAKKLNLSEGAVRKRISKLLETGVIKKFTIQQGGRGNVDAFILITLEKNAKSPKVISEIKNMKEVISAYEISGGIDIILHSTFLNTEHFNSFVDNLNTIDGIAKTNCKVIMREI